MTERPLSILYLIENCGRGGAETQIAMQAAAASALGHRALAAVPGTGWLTQQLARRGVRALSLSTQHGKAAPLRWGREVSRIVAAERIDIIQAYLLQMNIAAFIAGKLARVPAVASVRGQAYDFDRPWRLWAYRAMASLGATFTTPSHALRRALLDRARIAPHRVIAIHNGVDLARFDDLLARSPASQLPPGFRVGAVGRLDPVKGLDWLIRAAALAAPHAPDLHLLIVGDGPQRGALEQQARRAGIAARVTFLGQRDDVPAILKSLDLFVQVSLSEGLSNSLLEAMAAARPVIASNIGPNSEVVRHERNGMLVPPGDAEALARAILHCYHNRPFAAALGRCARATVEHEFTLGRSVQRHLALYRALLDGAAPAALHQAASPMVEPR